MNLAVEGYRRRRAWAAFHAGYGVHTKDAEIGHLLGRQAEKAPMSVEQMMANLDARLTAHNARTRGET
ncbi:hypothetical protein ACLBKU_12040 [Erythrobacter sp. NE805]|uniref:hypothetical protein n=1 Tax=Erythrobacter sp. NE805 TaxID=3389875 RepID=UPI00396B1DB5